MGVSSCLSKSGPFGSRRLSIKRFVRSAEVNNVLKYTFHAIEIGRCTETVCSMEGPL